MQLNWGSHCSLVRILCRCWVCLSLSPVQSSPPVLRFLQATGKRFVMDSNFKLGDLLKLGLHNCVDACVDIVDRAQKELLVEKVRRSGGQWIHMFPLLYQVAPKSQLHHSMPFCHPPCFPSLSTALYRLCTRLRRRGAV